MYSAVIMLIGYHQQHIIRGKIPHDLPGHFIDPQQFCRVVQDKGLLIAAVIHIHCAAARHADEGKLGMEIGMIASGFSASGLEIIEKPLDFERELLFRLNHAHSAPVVAELLQLQQCKPLIHSCSPLQ